jgi:hypothetical protein
MTATAPKRARVIDTLRTHGTADVRQRLAADAPHDRDQMVQHLTRRAKALGYALVATPTGTPMERLRRRNSSLEGPRLSRDRLSLGADFFSFAACRIRATSARGLGACLDCSVWVQVRCACTKHVLRFDRQEMAMAERRCTVLYDLETSRYPRTVLLKDQAERGSFAR